MKPEPIFLLGMTLLAICGPASAQTTPAPAPNTPPGKGVPHPKGAAAPPRTASVSAVKIDTSAFRRLGLSAVKIDTAAFRRLGRPADAILIRVRDIPQSVPSKN